MGLSTNEWRIFNHWYRWYFSAQDTIQMMRNGASLVKSLIPRDEGPGLTKD